MDCRWVYHLLELNYKKRFGYFCCHVAIESVSYGALDHRAAVIFYRFIPKTTKNNLTGGETVYFFFFDEKKALLSGKHFSSNHASLRRLISQKIAKDFDSFLQKPRVTTKRKNKKMDRTTSTTTKNTHLQQTYVHHFWGTPSIQRLQCFPTSLGKYNYISKYVSARHTNQLNHRSSLNSKLISMRFESWLFEHDHE